MKKHWHIVALAVAVSALALAGCATKPKAPAEIPNAEPSSIQAEATGLAPSGEEHFKSIKFALLFGSKDSVASWSIAVVDQKQKTAVRTQKGGSADIPEVFSWDGKDDSGKLAAEGSYSAELTVDYAGKYQPGSASSKPFILDLTPPSASFSPSPAQFAYAPDGVPAPISVTVSVKQALAKSASWTIDIFDAAGNPSEIALRRAPRQPGGMGRQARPGRLRGSREDLSRGPHRFGRVREQGDLQRVLHDGRRAERRGQRHQYAAGAASPP